MSLWPPLDNGGRISSPAPVLSTELTVDYPQKQGVLRRARIEVFPGEFLGLVGQSGSGKTALALAILRLLGHTGASVHGSTSILGHQVDGLDERSLRDIRGRLVSLIPQSPSAALNPGLRIGTQLAEAWRAHSQEPWSSQTPRITQLLKTVGLSPEEGLLQRFPAEISQEHPSLLHPLIEIAKNRLSVARSVVEIHRELDHGKTPRKMTAQRS